MPRDGYRETVRDPATGRRTEIRDADYSIRGSVDVAGSLTQSGQAVGAVGGLTNDAPSGTVPVTTDGDGNLGDSKITSDGDANPIIGFKTTANGNVQLQVVGVGGQLFINAADGDASHVGGEIQITSGGSAGNNGGDIQISAAPDTGTGDGGNVSIVSGGASDGADGGGNSGSIDIKVAPGLVADSQGGSVNISAGQGRTGGGSVIINAAARTVSGSHGTVQIYSANQNNSLELNNSGLFVTAPVLDITGVAKLEPVAFASLPASPEEGMLAWVNDSNTATWGATIAGGGANKVLAVYNGTNWTVAAK